MLVLDRWFYTDCEDVARIFPSSVFPPFVPRCLRRRALKFLFLPKLVVQTQGQGMGRHAREEVIKMGK